MQRATCTPTQPQLHRRPAAAMRCVTRENKSRCDGNGTGTAATEPSDRNRCRRKRTEPHRTEADGSASVRQVLLCTKGGNPEKAIDILVHNLNGFELAERYGMRFVGVRGARPSVYYPVRPCNAPPTPLHPAIKPGSHLVWFPVPRSTRSPSYTVQYPVGTL